MAGTPDGQEGSAPAHGVVRRWVAADVDRIGWIHARSRQSAYAGLVPAEALARVTPEHQAEVWRTRLPHLSDPHAGFVLEHESVVAGFALAQLDPAEGAELTAIHVLPERFGTGAGQALLHAVVDTFREWGVDEAHLFVLEGNDRAQAFYRRHGWRLRGPAGRHDIGGAEVAILEYRLRVG